MFCSCRDAPNHGSATGQIAALVVAVAVVAAVASVGAAAVEATGDGGG